MEYGRCRFVSVRNILQQLDGSEVTVLRNHVVHPHTAVLFRQYPCLAVKSLLLQQPPQYREVARIEETRTFFTKLPVGTYIRLLFLSSGEYLRPPERRFRRPAGQDLTRKRNLPLSTRKTEGTVPPHKKEGKNKSRNIGNLLYIGMRCGNRVSAAEMF